MTIKLGNSLFVIEDVAFRTLESYLNSFRSCLGGAYGSDEVMEDLESRIADIFSSEISAYGGVVTVDMVNRVITRMGMPDGSNAGTTSSSASPRPIRKKLYRSRSDRLLAGVCSGLGTYLGIDTAIVRIIFIILFIMGSAGGWIYIILAIVVPVADNPYKRCEMFGVEPTFDNLKRYEY